MTRHMTARIVLAITFAAVLHAAPATALPARTWVAKTGSDTNPCTITAPCRTFQGAHDKTAPGGTVSVLTPGDYGPVKISKSISTTNDGVGEAGLTSTGSGETGIDVFADATPGMVIGLRGLTVDGGGMGGAGIRIGAANGAAVHIQNCVVRNFDDGITFGASGHARLFVSDAVIHNNGSNFITGGIVVSALANANVDVVLDRVRLENNGNGLWVDLDSAGAGINVLVRDSVVSGNVAHGILASTGANMTAFVFVRNSSLANNGMAGIFVDGPGGTIVMSKATIVRNGTGLVVPNGGQIVSFSNNEIDNNIGADGAPTSLKAPR